MAKIAIVEDEEAIANMYEQEFKLSGYDVVVAHNGQEGLEICEKTKPDIALIDIMMPVMDGREMLEKMRGTDWGKKILVMMLTNLNQPEAQLDRSKQRFDDYAVKVTHTPQQLVDKVTELLKVNGIVVQK